MISDCSFTSIFMDRQDRISADLALVLRAASRIDSIAQTSLIPAPRAAVEFMPDKNAIESMGYTLTHRCIILVK